MRPRGGYFDGFRCLSADAHWRGRKRSAIVGRNLGIDLVEGLSSLVDKNLVYRVDRAEAEPRFAMLETIREYALERLIDSGEQSATRRAHAAYCLVLAEEGNPN